MNVRALPAMATRTRRWRRARQPDPLSERAVAAVLHPRTGTVSPAPQRPPEVMSMPDRPAPPPRPARD